MKKEIIIPVLKDEDVAAANLRRDRYSAKRDIKAQEFNDAIAARLLAEATVHIKCEKCGKEFEQSSADKDSKNCPDCN